jgi:hypothetical protein
MERMPGDERVQEVESRRTSADDFIEFYWDT